jgi:hypothetical protein
VLHNGSLINPILKMIQKRPRIKFATLEASSNPLTNIKAKRLIMLVKYVAGFNPRIISIQAQGIKTKNY